MGPVEFPGNPGSADSFASQVVGSGEDFNKKKKIKLLSFYDFLNYKKAK